MSASAVEAERVLRFWFGDPSDASFGQPRKQWFAKDTQFDAQVQAEFGALHAALASGAHPEWQDQPRTCLAYVIVLDQFSRNLFRDDPRAFAHDARSLAASRQAVARGFDNQLQPIERVFLYMPFMHSEALSDQDLCITLFERMGDAPGAPENLRYAKLHRDIIARFGRFPHRNHVLGRASSAEEIAFLKQPNSSF